MLWSRKQDKVDLATDEEAFDEIVTLLDALGPVLRYLDDLKSVWPALSDEERREIEASRPHRDQYHQKRARFLAEQLQDRLGASIVSGDRDLQNELNRFARQWRTEEPDLAKILLARLLTWKKTAAARDLV